MRAFLFVLLAGWGMSALADDVINNMRIWHEPNRTRIVFDLSAGMYYETFLLQNPPRVVVDLPKAKFMDPRAMERNPGPLIDKMRMGSGPNGDRLRFVFDLTQPVNFTDQAMTPSGTRGHRIVLDFAPASGTIANTGVVVGSINDEPSTIVSMPTPAVAKPAAESAPAPPQKARPVPVPESTPDTVIVIDPGHGGALPGAVGPKGTLEKDIALSIGLLLRDRINKTPGMRAVMTRDRDVNVPLRKRVRIAEDNNALVFISIHADGFKNSKARGFSVYALSRKGATSEEAKRLAARENNELAGGEDLSDMEAPVRSLMLDLALDKTREWGVDLGKAVLRELDKIGPLKRTRVEKAGFMVLKAPQVAAILVETGFITNKSEERLLNSRKYQRKIADAILRGVKPFVVKNAGI